MSSSYFKKDQVVIAIEGGGGTGKTKTAREVVKSLRECGLNTCLIKLPCYLTPTGVQIEEMLKGNLFLKGNSQAQFLFAENRAEVSYVIKSLVEGGWSFVFDRWTSANTTSGEVYLKYPPKLGPRRLTWEDVDEEKILENFVWLRNLDKYFLELFEGIPVVKVLLEGDVSSSRRAREKRIGEIVHDVYEGRGLEELKIQILKKYIELEGGWTVIRRGVRTPEELCGSVMRKVVSDVGINNERLSRVWKEGSVPKGKFLDFNERLEYYHPRAYLDGIRSSLLELEGLRLDLEHSATWSLMAERSRERV